MRYDESAQQVVLILNTREEIKNNLYTAKCCAATATAVVFIFLSMLFALATAQHTLQITIRI